MILRSMSEQDIDAVYDIERAVNAFPWSLQQLLSSLDSSDQCSVAWESNNVIGYSIFSAVLDEATLLNIAVSPDHQRRGCGRAILQQGLMTLQQQGIVNCYLEVRASNARAIALYQSVGFNAVGNRKAYYPAIDGREDAVVMCKELLKNQSEGV